MKRKFSDMSNGNEIAEVTEPDTKRIKLQPSNANQANQHQSNDDIDTTNIFNGQIISSHYRQPIHLKHHLQSHL